MSGPLTLNLRHAQDGRGGSTRAGSSPQNPREGCGSVCTQIRCPTRSSRWFSGRASKPSRSRRRSRSSRPPAGCEDDTVTDRTRCALSSSVVLPNVSRAVAKRDDVTLHAGRCTRAVWPRVNVTIDSTSRRLRSPCRRFWRTWRHRRDRGPAFARLHLLERAVRARSIAVARFERCQEREADRGRELIRSGWAP